VNVASQVLRNRYHFCERIPKSDCWCCERGVVALLRA